VQSTQEKKMVQIIGLFVMFISFYCLQDNPFDWGMVQALGIGVLLFCSEALVNHFSFVQREKVRAHYRRRS
jgi:membrane-bound ClpP family serine protease